MGKRQNHHPRDTQRHAIADRVLILCAPRSRMGTKQRQGWGHRGGKGTQRRGSSRNFFPWRRNLRAGGLFFHIRHPFAFLPLGGDPVFALTCVQAHRHSQHPSTHKHTRWLCSWYRSITFRTFMGEDEFKTSQTLPPSRLPCPFPSELLLLLVWWHPEGLQSRRGSPRIALGVAKASGQDAKRMGAREGQVQEIFF